MSTECRSGVGLDVCLARKMAGIECRVSDVCEAQVFEAT
jgi:hypothetical protein